MRVPMAQLCDEDWASMAGSGHQRHCGRCDRAVVDLSALSERQARRAVASGACVRFETRPDGHVRHRRGALAILVAWLGLASPAVAREPMTASVTSDIAPLGQPADMEVGEHQVGIRAVDQDGFPLPNATVRVGNRTYSTDRDGEVRIDTTVPVAATVTKESLGSAAVEGLPPGAAIELTLHFVGGIIVGEASLSEMLKLERRNREALREAARQVRWQAHHAARASIEVVAGRVRRVAVTCGLERHPVEDGLAEHLPVGRTCAVRADGRRVGTFEAGNEPGKTLTRGPKE
ncbi:MAG: hypothetical protein H6735_28290 [Alphaproteobacteria bacterium]|nr:hypothetical protein [Alphaproteobacteria bacterium]